MEHPLIEIRTKRAAWLGSLPADGCIFHVGVGLIAVMGT